MISILKKEILRIASNDSIDLKIIEGERKGNIIDDVKNIFVYNNPRAFWLDFKFLTKSIEYNEDYPYLKLPDLVSKDEILYLLIDDFNDEFHVIEGRIKDIMFFIEDCEGLDEYYIVSQDLKRMICENDHDELLYINIHENKKKTNSTSFDNFKKQLTNKLSKDSNFKCSMYTSPAVIVYKSNLSFNDIVSVSEPAKDIALFVKIYDDDNSSTEYKYLNGNYEILN